MEKERKIREEGGSGFFGKLIALLLGFILGIGALGGGVFYYVKKKPIKDTVNLLDQAFELLGGTLDLPSDLYEQIFDEKSGYLNPNYANKYVGELLNDLRAAADSIEQGGPLSTLTNITPLLDPMIDDLLGEIDRYGISLDRDEFLSKGTEDLFDYLQENMQTAELGSILYGINGKEITDPLMLSLCYGTSNRYDKRIEKDGTPVYDMKQMVYFYEDKDLTDDDTTKKLYDIDGRLAQGTFNESAKTLTVKTETQKETSNGQTTSTTTKVETTVYYLKRDESVPDREAYLAYTDPETTVGAYYRAATLADFKGDAFDLIKDFTLADVLEIKKTTDCHHLLLLLAYGEEDIDYTVDADKNITPINPPRTIGELKNENEELLDGIYLKDALEVTDSSDPIMIALAYGVKGEDYYIDANKKIVPISEPRTLGALMDNGSDLINDVRLVDVMKNVDLSDSLTLFLLYGRSGVHYTLDQSGTPTMLAKKIAVLDGAVYNEYGEPLTVSNLNTSQKSFIMDGRGYTYSEITDASLITTVETKEGTATLYYLNDEQGKSVGNYSPTTLGDFTGESSLVSKMSDRITLNEMLGAEEVEGDKILRNLGNSTMANLTEDIKNLKISEVYKDDVYDADGNVKGEWWYLLHDYAHCTTGAAGHELCGGMHCEHCTHGAVGTAHEDCGERNCNHCIPGSKEHENCFRNNKNCIGDYTIENLGQLLDNMEKNMTIVTLYELNQDGIIELTDTTLNTELLSSISVPGYSSEIEGVPSGKKFLGEMTISEILTYSSNVLTVVNALQEALNR